jgi:hypothetical protein
MQDKTYRRGNIFCGILLKKSIYNRKEKHMKVRKLKTRIAAFGLAVLMGISTLSSANAFAAEQTGSEQQTEVQASEQAVTSQKDTSVTADDITKAVSDDTFAVETSMEGIHYDAEKEDVTLVSIKDENGGEYHSDKAGTYIATYMVVPKDKSDSYTITRKVTLTDTEGQAHSEENGGEKQKSDTESEDDSDSPVQNYTDVEIETSEEDASAQAIKELKEDIEEGNVMVLSAAERATSSGSTVTLTKGRTIYYPSYIGNYLTCLFTVNGKIAYCLQSQKASPPSGSYVAQVLDSNKNLQKVLYYGYGGAGDLTGSYLPENRTVQSKGFHDLNRCHSKHQWDCCRQTIIRTHFPCIKGIHLNHNRLCYSDCISQRHLTLACKLSSYYIFCDIPCHISCRTVYFRTVLS